MTRVLQITDTHLSRRVPDFVANFERLLDHIAENVPDLVVNTGDLAVDGPDHDDDLAYAAELHARIPVPWLAIPGNHDIGDNPDPGRPAPKQPVTEAAIARFRGLFGDDRFVHDCDGWRLVGLNSLLFNSGLDAEAGQWTFLEDALASAGDRRAALFLHKPLFAADPAETPDKPSRYVPGSQRDRLMALVGEHRVGLVACGHVHQAYVRKHGDTTYVWGPSSAFILPDRFQPRIGAKLVGAVAYDFRPGRCDIAILRPDGLDDIDLADRPNVYGPLPPVTPVAA